MDFQPGFKVLVKLVFAGHVVVVIILGMVISCSKLLGTIIGV